MSPAEAHEVKGYDALMELHDVYPDKLLGDKGYDSDDIRNDLNARIATRYEKTARAYLSMLCIAAARLWIKTVNTA